MEIDAKTIHDELTTALWPNALSYCTVARWARRFHEGREDVNGSPPPGRSASELTEENIELVRQIINNDPRSTYDEIIAEAALARNELFKTVLR